MPYKDKEKQKELARKHYAKNKDIYKDRAKAHNKVAIARNKEYVLNYLLEHPCIDCGLKDPIILEFDHITDNKVANISNAVKSGWSLEKLQKEIAKCEVRCANCHRRVTYNRRNIARY